MTRESQKKSKGKPLKLVLILGLIILGIIAGKYIIQAISPPSWTDSTITAGETLIRKVHIDELRSEIDANRADVGLATTTWTDSTITAGQTLIRAVHFTEARTALEGIFTKIEDSLPFWTNATITPGTTIIRKTHLDEVRASTTVAYNSINAKKCCGSYGGSDTGSAGACSGTDDSACGEIDCSEWYIQTGTEGVEDTEYCYNKQNITTNRCEEIDDCKDANTADCDPQATSTQQYSCEPCKYIHDTNDCYQTTLGSCTNYANGTSCGAVGDYCRDGSCLSWGLLNENCSGIGDWTNNDKGNGVSEVSPAGQFRFDTNISAATNDYASRYRNIGSPPDKFVIEIKTYFDNIGSHLTGDPFFLDCQQDDWVFRADFGTDGLEITKAGGVGEEIGTDLVKCNAQAAWQTWQFHVDKSGGVAEATVEVFLDGASQGTVDCDWETEEYTDGRIRIQQYGYGNDDQVAHVDYIKIGG